MPTYRVDVSYDGSGFHGFARQRSVRTVQGELEATLAQVLRTPVRLTAAGRTDAGVHARQQVVTFAVDREMDPRRIARAVTSILGPEIVATSAAVVDDGFDARFSATRRAYRYRVLNAPVPDPLRRHTVWHVSSPLDLERMNRAAAHVVGEHDFASFCRRAEGRTTTRTVFEASWSLEGDLTVFAIAARAFCHQMVRSITGFCVDAGRERVDPDTMPAVLEALDRGAARDIAPPTGLVLWEVTYG